jgi:hypothetical protein
MKPIIIPTTNNDVLSVQVVQSTITPPGTSQPLELGLLIENTETGVYSIALIEMAKVDDLILALQDVKKQHLSTGSQ